MQHKIFEQHSQFLLYESTEYNFGINSSCLSTQTITDPQQIRQKLAKIGKNGPLWAPLTPIGVAIFNFFFFFFFQKKKK